MAFKEKNRIVNFISNIVLTTATANTIAAKTTILEIFKSKPFVDFRFKFKAFYIQVRLNI
jgi:hypothetical protein